MNPLGSSSLPKVSSGFGFPPRFRTGKIQLDRIVNYPNDWVAAKAEIEKSRRFHEAVSPSSKLVGQSSTWIMSPLQGRFVTAHRQCDGGASWQHHKSGKFGHREYGAQSSGKQIRHMDATNGGFRLDTARGTDVP